ADAKTKTTTTNYLPASFAATHVDNPASSLETRTLQADGSVDDGINFYASASAAGPLLAASPSHASANGLPKTLSWDLNGDGTIDQAQSDVTTLGADGSTSETFTESDAFLGTNFTENVAVTTVTSANGLTSSVSASINLGEDWSLVDGSRAAFIN